MSLDHFLLGQDPDLPGLPMSVMMMWWYDDEDDADYDDADDDGGGDDNDGMVNRSTGVFDLQRM